MRRADFLLVNWIAHDGEKEHTKMREDTNTGVWFVYDGHCPICTTAARALRIKQGAGPLHLVNAREARNHPLIEEINARRLNLDDGMVLKYQGICYHGEDALHMMALLGSPIDWFNRMNALLFSSRTLAWFCYPAMRAMRNLLLRRKGASRIKNLAAQPDGDQKLRAIVRRSSGRE